MNVSDFYETCCMAVLLYASFILYLIYIKTGQNTCLVACCKTVGFTLSADETVA